MANEGVYRGYLGLFTPPYSLLSQTYSNTIYCIRPRVDNLLILIPLVPNFYIDVVQLLKMSACRNIYFIVPDFGPRFVSDYINCWNYITKDLGRQCKLCTKYLPDGICHLGQDLQNDIERNKDDIFNFTIPVTDVDTYAINIELTRRYVATWAPTACDVIVNDNSKRILLTSEMNEYKAKFFNDNFDLYDEIHIPHISDYHYGMSYLKVLQKFPKLIHKLVVHSIHNDEELNYIKEHRIRGGELIRNYDSL